MAARFDASVDIDLSALRPWERRAALESVGERLRQIPGAGWISVEHHDGAGCDVRLFSAGSGVPEEGGDWEELRRQVQHAGREAIARTRREQGGWEVPVPMQAGFAEAFAPSQFDALQQLAALAQSARAAAAPPTPEPGPEPVLEPAPPPELPLPTDDVGRLAGLLALVLPTDAHGTAAAAVRRFGSYAGVLAAPEAELRRIPGLGQHSIAAVKLVHAASVRLARARITARPVLDDRQRLFDYLAAALARERIEQFRILFLDEHGMLRADEVQAQGTVNHTPVYPREVVRRALALGAVSLVLVHNHPSGDPAPSRDDIEMTRQVQEAAAIMDIALRDHVIVGNGRWLSFRDEGYLK